MYQKTPESITVTEATKKMEHYCVYQERCHKDINDKLSTMKLIPEAKEKIIIHLLEHDFLNEERFAKSFARGKFRIKKWGKQRIIRELKFRQLSEYCIKVALKEIPENEYLTTFHKLAEKQFILITEKDIYKKRKKLIDYLLYRGWENQLVFEKAKELS
ncbi:regulatory protein RecX [Aquimarina sp. M1]